MQATIYAFIFCGGFFCSVFMFYFESAMETESKFCFRCLSSTESFIKQLRMRGEQEFGDNEIKCLLH